MIIVIVGTNRPDSNTSKVAKTVIKIFEEAGAGVEAMDLAELPPEIFHPSSYEAAPESFTPFTNRVLESEGLVVVTPEYNGGMPGVLKYFIDMLPFPESFERRPVCFVGLSAGRWGALRPVEQLQSIFGYRNAHIFPERVFLPGVDDLLADDGSIADEAITGRLAKQAAGFLKFVAALKRDT